MGKRKLPFGYRMEMGKTALQLQEAETVQFIFQQYGASEHPDKRELLW